MKFCCDELRDHCKNEELGIIFYPKFLEFGLLVQDGGSSFIEIYYCPWCGEKLPNSVRDLRFKMIDKLPRGPDGALRFPEGFDHERWLNDCQNGED